MAKETEVRTKLKLDDQASKVLANIKSGFRDADAAQQKAQQGLGDFARQFATQFAAINLMPVIHQITAFGKSIIDAAAAEDAAITATGGLIAAVQGIPFDTAREQAEAIDNELDQLGVNKGVAGLGEGFQALIEQMGATRESVAQARAQIGQIATIAGVLGKDAGMISREFGFMQEGVLRTKGQLFQLLQTTGIFGDKTKGAAAEWAKLTEEERAQRLASGIGQIAERMGRIPPSFKQTTQSLENMVEVAKETMGAPLLEAIQPALQDLIKELQTATPEIAAYAKELGKDVGKWVKDAGKMIQEGFTWIKTHSDEIGAAVRDAFFVAKSVVEFILAHKEELALAFGAKLAMPIVQGAVSAGQSVVGAAATGAPAAGLAASAAGSAAALGALALAIGGLGLAAWQAGKLVDDLAVVEDMRKNEKQQLEDLAAAGKTEQLENMVAAINETAQQASFLEKAMVGVDDKGRILENSLGMSGEAFDQFTSVLQANAAMVNKETASVTQAMADASAVDVVGLAELYNQAASVNNAAAMRYGANLLIQSGITAFTLEESGIKLVGGLGRFTELFAGAAGDTLQMLDAFKGAGGGAGGKPLVVPKGGVHMSGGQTFKIQQDFREQDPDRVAIAFQRDIMRVANRRVQAASSTPFGT